MAATSGESEFGNDFKLRNRQPGEPTDNEDGLRRRKVDDEFDERRRRIANVFMQAYGTELKDIDAKKLAKLRERAEANEEEVEKPFSPYNLQTIFWILATFAIFYYTDFIDAIKVDPRVNRPWLYSGALLIGVNITIGFYLIVICSWIRKIEDWEIHAPIAIPMATTTFIMGGLCVNIALWPVYGFLTPLMLFTVFMGFVVLVSLLPNKL
ncbi:transmembrane protein 128-like [Amphiura filiformis]|uniref:transmembrane protein 128-like n=1 Tax=Amphiura filiformis TaxID=82378 RepID=UPI003B219D9A